VYLIWGLHYFLHGVTEDWFVIFTEICNWRRSSEQRKRVPSLSWMKSFLFYFSLSFLLGEESLSSRWEC